MLAKPQQVLLSLFSFFLVSPILAEHNGPIHEQTARTCSVCHQEIYDQWRGSMHAQSSALKDPIHGAM